MIGWGVGGGGGGYLLDSRLLARFSLIPTHAKIRLVEFGKKKACVALFIYLLIIHLILMGNFNNDEAIFLRKFLSPH